MVSIVFMSIGCLPIINSICSTKMTIESNESIHSICTSQYVWSNRSQYVWSNRIICKLSLSLSFESSILSFHFILSLSVDCISACVLVDRSIHPSIHPSMASKLLAVARRSPRLRSLLHPPSPSPSLSPPFPQPSPLTPLGPSFSISPHPNNPPVFSFLRSHHKVFCYSFVFPCLRAKARYSPFFCKSFSLSHNKVLCSSSGESLSPLQSKCREVVCKALSFATRGICMDVHTFSLSQIRKRFLCLS